ncbi:MAG: hypothetical protein ABL876_04780, partial [Chitinophagaceae bacterium]
TATIGFMANIHIGNLQVIPYLTSERYKLLYAHSMFNTKTLEPATNRQVTTILDDILDTFKARELASNSSFLIQKNSELFIGVFNKEKELFIIFRFRNKNL